MYICISTKIILIIYYKRNISSVLAQKTGLYAAINLIKENKDLTFYHEIAFAAKEAMEKDVAKAIKVFNDKIVD